MQALLTTVGDLLCRHHDSLPAGVNVTELRLAMRELAQAGHLGCRLRVDSVSWIGELDDDKQPLAWASDREANSV